MTTIRFLWVPERSHWEIRELFGAFIYRVRGTIALSRWQDGDQHFWTLEFDTGERWLGDLSQILLLFDMAELYLNNDQNYLSSLSAEP